MKPARTDLMLKIIKVVPKISYQSFDLWQFLDLMLRNAWSIIQKSNGEISIFLIQKNNSIITFFVKLTRSPMYVQYNNHYIGSISSENAKKIAVRPQRFEVEQSRSAYFVDCRPASCVLGDRRPRIQHRDTAPVAVALVLCKSFPNNYVTGCKLRS